MNKKNRVFASRYRWINLALTIVLPFVLFYGGAMLLVDWDFSTASAGWWTMGRIFFCVVAVLLFVDRLIAFSARLVIAEPFLVFSTLQRFLVIPWDQVQRVDTRLWDAIPVPTRIHYRDGEGGIRSLPLEPFLTASSARDLADQVTAYSSQLAA